MNVPELTDVEKSIIAIRKRLKTNEYDDFLARKQIAKLAENLSGRGVPDTVAYVTREEVLAALKPLRKLGYREKDIQSAFQSPPPPVSFVHIQFSA
ncbi:MAG TPA: hypothetical protein EYQ03_09950 [Nitrospinaceae bacterium]|nr:hypothetical protein [Nitrospinaceae bacterium]